MTPRRQWAGHQPGVGQPSRSGVPTRQTCRPRRPCPLPRPSTPLCLWRQYGRAWDSGRVLLASWPPLPVTPTCGSRTSPSKSGSRDARRRSGGSACRTAGVPCAGSFTLPEWVDAEYVGQLTAEKAVPQVKKPGTVREWIKTRERNEALDLEVYCLAALYIFRPSFVEIPARARGRPGPAGRRAGGEGSPARAPPGEAAWLDRRVAGMSTPAARRAPVSGRVYPWAPGAHRGRGSPSPRPGTASPWPPAPVGAPVEPARNRPVRSPPTAT